MVKVMCFGTFDRLHEGHRFYLRESRKSGDELIVVVSLDATVQKVKGRLPALGQAARLKQVEASGLADRAVLGSSTDKFEFILKEKPDVIALGYDQKVFTDGIEEKLKERGLAKVRVERIGSFHPEKYKSSILNRRDF